MANQEGKEPPLSQTLFSVIWSCLTLIAGIYILWMAIISSGALLAITSAVIGIIFLYWGSVGIFRSGIICPSCYKWSTGFVQSLTVTGKDEDSEERHMKCKYCGHEWHTVRSYWTSE